MKLLPCDAPRRSAINPHLTRIWSQFGRGSRPRAGGTARVHAPRKEPRPRGGTSATPPPSELPRPTALFQVQMHFFFFKFNLLLAISEPTFPGWFSILPDRSLYTAGDVSIPPPPPGTVEGPQETVPRGQGRCVWFPACPWGLHSLLRFLCFPRGKKIKKKKESKLAHWGRFPQALTALMIIGLWMLVN